MLEIVGEILVETGFAGLKTNNIARKLGKDKNLVRYYFQSLLNLEKEFIIEKDHWITFFKQLDLPDEPDAEWLRQVFITFVKEHFGSFTENAEMQKVMLWQLTEQNPLIKSIVDYRENQAEPLLKAIEPVIPPGPEFRAALAMVFGGLYFLALQAAENNGSVWGIDINLQQDRDAVLAAAERFINDAW